MSWSTRLRHPIKLSDGRILHTLGDARDMVLALPAKDQRLGKWQELADLLMRTERAGNPSLTAVTTGKIEEALRRPPFSAARLEDDDAIKRPPAPSVDRAPKSSPKRRRKLH
jgi:hypothetical protein